MAKTRTFVAIKPSPVVRRRAREVITQLRPYAGDARWVGEDSLHLTLSFLGDLSDSEVAEACQRVRGVAAELPPFAFQVSGVSAFPSIDRPRAIWLGVAEGEASIGELQSRLAEALRDLADRSENRAFIPHLTVARLGRRDRVSPELPGTLSSLSSCEVGRVDVEQVVVVASELGASGPEHFVLASCPLGIGG